MGRLVFKTSVREADDGGYVASVPGEDVTATGDTPGAALAALGEAVDDADITPVYER